MTEFYQAVLEFPFVRYALLAGILVSMACGIIGTYVVVRRITYIAGGIAHCVLGGMGLAGYLQQVHHWSFAHPFLGALAAALAAAVIIGFVSLKARQREDTIISALWAVGMAVGVIFISQTPGYNQDLMSYLFGNILMVSGTDLWLILALNAIIGTVALFFHNQLRAVCFDEEHARIRGVPVEALFILLLCLTALTVVLLVTVVGIVMVIALLTIPVAIAGQFTRSLGHMMGLSILLSMGFTTGGLAISYAPDWPPGAVIILLAGGFYMVVLAAGWLFRRRSTS
ncbi:MAG: metal ABC transporter permease [Acidobacteria bacterium]|nr:metal ABC transporter permease [Acidobacteriota bacterium]